MWEVTKSAGNDTYLMSDMQPSKSCNVYGIPCDDKWPSSTYKERLWWQYDYSFVSRTKQKMPRKKWRWGPAMICTTILGYKATTWYHGARVACLHNKKRVKLWWKIVKERVYDLLMPRLQLICHTGKKVEDAMDTYRDNLMTSVMKWRATRESSRQYDHSLQEFLMLQWCITIRSTMTYTCSSGYAPKRFTLPQILWWWRISTQAQRVKGKHVYAERLKRRVITDDFPWSMTCTYYLYIIKFLSIIDWRPSI